ncbi:hypothetical protein C2G38_2216612 [Gigaspora rosea]|uniref:Uncharacterized protein n=1 Tax=Gigaspora rosea TaxID=44941 RepID=A0A397U8P4_9GLOM|nr:hypothetical protein C2G38_2216612 [Gigaspora rosea]
MSLQNIPIMLKAFKRNLHKKGLRIIKKAKIEKFDSSIVSEGASTFNSSANQIEERTNIFYDPLKIPDFNKCFKHHCCRLWSKVNHEYREAQKKMQKVYNISETFGRPSNYKLDVAEKTTRDVATGEDDTIVVVNKYYSHNLNKNNKLHKSKEFKKGLVEHFEAFIGNNNEPYTTANTASNHCLEHRKSRFGPNVSKSFSAFPTIAINFNIISQFYRNLKDHRNTLCVVCPLGIFKDGQLVFPELKLIIHAREGQAITFRLNNLVHSNLPVIADLDNLDSEIDVHMNNNKKLRISKKCTMQNKK